MDYRGPIYNQNGTIDVEIDHPRYGWIPFTANFEDVEEFGRAVFEELKIVAKPYTPQE